MIEFVGQKDMFRHVRTTRQHKCEICGKRIQEPKTWCFSHNLAKGQYPEFKLVPENITLVCSIECHEANDKRFKGGAKRDFEEKLKSIKSQKALDF